MYTASMGYAHTHTHTCTLRRFRMSANIAMYHTNMYTFYVCEYTYRLTFLSCFPAICAVNRFFFFCNKNVFFIFFHHTCSAAKPVATTTIIIILLLCVVISNGPRLEVNNENHVGLETPNPSSSRMTDHVDGWNEKHRFNFFFFLSLLLLKI